MHQGSGSRVQGPGSSVQGPVSRVQGRNARFIRPADLHIIIIQINVLRDLICHLEFVVLRSSLEIAKAAASAESGTTRSTGTAEFQI